MIGLNTLKKFINEINFKVERKKAPNNENMCKSKFQLIKSIR